MLRLTRPVELPARCILSTTSTTTTTTYFFRPPSVRRSYATKQHDPLRILFCGADEFSNYALTALKQLQGRRPDKISSIDVVCRPDKRVGRGLKKVQQVPIKPHANHLSLPLHQLDTFTRWTPPPGINLVITVSFGLLVPSRILSGATYGGLNLHPSLLPDLRGPAPVLQALLKRRAHTGVSLQTMHPERFDAGEVLMRTETPGFEVPAGCAPGELLRLLGREAAEMLVRGVEEAVFVPPVKGLGASQGLEGERRVEYAAKLTPEDRRVVWGGWSAEEVVVRDRVLGRLWDLSTYRQCVSEEGATAKRVTFQGPWEVRSAEAKGQTPGTPVLVHGSGAEVSLGFPTADGNIVVPDSATVEGEGRGKALPFLLNRRKETLAKSEEHS